MGWVSSVLWMPRLADSYGRAMIYKISMIGNIICIFFMHQTKDVKVMVGVMAGLGFLNSARTTIGFNYMNEFIPKSHKAIIGTLVKVSDSLAFLFTTIYFGWVAKTWIYPFYIGLSLCLLNLVGAFFLPESPKYLL